jgi:hypothetical protein
VYVVAVWVDQDPFGNAAEYVSAGVVEASAANHDQVSSDLVGDRRTVPFRPPGHGDGYEVP